MGFEVRETEIEERKYLKARLDRFKALFDDMPSSLIARDRRRREMLESLGVDLGREIGEHVRVSTPTEDLDDFIQWLLTDSHDAIQLATSATSDLEEAVRQKGHCFPSNRMLSFDWLNRWLSLA